MALENVIFISGLSESLTNYFKQSTHSQLIVLVDENTNEHCYPLLQKLLPEHETFQIQSGEEEKNLQTCQKIWQWMTDLKLDRKALLLNLGGGVIGDMGGFCAATYKRGIDFIQIPTTLLAQVDASVGGKLGIDFQGFKNQIGVFQQPKEVWIYPEFLQTLPQRELLSGFAEVIKHALIANTEHWQFLQEQHFPNLDWSKIIQHSVEIKSNVVEQDPKEKGLRKILNFGHTIGHAIESYFLDTDKKLLHGEAIAWGMLLEAELSFLKGYLSENEVINIRKFIQDLYPSISIHEKEWVQIKKLMLQDKKNESGIVKGILLDGIGKAIFDIDYQESDLDAVYKNIMRLS